MIIVLAADVIKNSVTPEGTNRMFEIETQNLTTNFGGLVALNNLNLQTALHIAACLVKKTKDI